MQAGIGREWEGRQTLMPAGQSAPRHKCVPACLAYNETDPVSVVTIFTVPLKFIRVALCLLLSIYLE